MRCSMCGHESPPGSSFCLNCGSSLAPAVGADSRMRRPGCPASVRVCRGENPPGMKFCRSVRRCARRLAAAVRDRASAIAPGDGRAARWAGRRRRSRAGRCRLRADRHADRAGPGAVRRAGAARHAGRPMPRARSRRPPVPRTPQSPACVAQGSTITCPRCGTPTPIGFAYCQQCGLHMQAIAADRSRRSAAARRAPPSTRAADRQPRRSTRTAATLAQPDASGRELARVARAVPAAARDRAAERARRPGRRGARAVLVNRDGTDGQRFALTSDDTRDRPHRCRHRVRRRSLPRAPARAARARGRRHA